MRQYIRHPTEIPIDVCADIDGEAETDHLADVSSGGLCFFSAHFWRPGALLTLRVPMVAPHFATHGQVVWCRQRSGGFQTGVIFTEPEKVFEARMVEQICHIEHYRRAVLAQEGRDLSGPQAAAEWIARYGAQFPAL